MPVNITIVQKDLELLMQILAEQIPEIREGPRNPPKIMFDAVDNMTVSDDIAPRVKAILADENWRMTGQKKKLMAHAAEARWRKETAGIVVGGVFMPTDRDTYAALTQEMPHAAANSYQQYHWKTGAGTFIAMNANQLVNVASAVSRYVQRCRSAEAKVAADIADGSVTTAAEIDAVFAKITA